MRQAVSTLMLVLATGALAVAHKTITSKYTYNEHVYPIVVARCARCHRPDGPAPMSLLSYNDALPWAESIREQVSGEAMPPWPVDMAGPAVKGGHFPTARELDILLTWASGGAPEGDIPLPSRTTVDDGHWKAGLPDLVVQIPAHTLPAGTTVDTQEFVMNPGIMEERWVRLVDVRPGNPSMVRSATVSVVDGPVLSAWVPGDDAVSTPSGSAFRMAAGAQLLVRIHYKKNWQDEQVTRSDRSEVGLYFTEPSVSGRGIEALQLAGTQRTVGPTRILALRPRLVQPYSLVHLDALLPTGRRIPLLRLNRPRPGWDRRYWLAEPVELPKDTLLELTTAPLDEGQPSVDSNRADVALDVQPL